MHNARYHPFIGHTFQIELNAQNSASDKHLTAAHYLGSFCGKTFISTFKRCYEQMGCEIHLS